MRTMLLPPRIASLLALGALLVLLLAPEPGLAAKEGAAAPDPPPAPEILALLNADAAVQAGALDVLRRNPPAARAALVQALRREQPLQGRWRLIFRLMEFGAAEDVPLLLQLRAGAQNEWERRIAEGAARSLYNPVANATGLDSLVQDFSFIQTQPPAPVDDPARGKWMLTRWSLADYARYDVPLEAIKQVRTLRGKPFDTRAQLSEAIQKRLAPRDWKALQTRLQASLETIPARVQLEGLARVRLLNPLQRPLLLRISLDAWFGRYRDPPGDAWVYLEPNATVTVDLPVAPQGYAERPQVRLDLRLEEIDGGYLPGIHKLYLPLQP